MITISNIISMPEGEKAANSRNYTQKGMDC